MLKIIDGQDIPKTKNARQKIKFLCDCGRTTEIIWKNYANNHTKSCGKCRLFNKEKLKLKYGKLSVADNQDFSNITSNSKIIWKCDCGNTKNIVIKSVINGYTKSCGCGGHIGTKWVRPVMISKEEWLNTELPLKLIDDGTLPHKWSKGTLAKMQWVCTCGRTFSETFGDVYSGHRKTCSRCKYVLKEDIMKMKFGKLSLIGTDLPDEFHYGTTKKVLFKCDCGKEKALSFAKVYTQHQITCGDCNLFNNEELIGKVFGHLTVIGVDENIKYKKWTESKVLVRCTCGEEKYIAFAGLVNYHTSTCGGCYEKGIMWWKGKNRPTIDGCSSKSNKYSLEYLQSYFDGSFIKPLEGCNALNDKIKFQCLLCGSEYKTFVSSIFNSKVVSCGCIIPSFSRGSVEIGRYVESLGFVTYYGKNEKKLDKWPVDVFVEEKNLIIEFNGLKYHGERTRDIKKYQELSQKYDYMMIYEDEWEKKKDLFKNLIKNKLKKEKPQPIRPRNCIIRLISNNESNEFYEKFHYQGGCNNSLNLGVFFDEKLVACLSIRKPTRQNSGDYEISRMASDFGYRVHGIWSFLLNHIKEKKLISGKLVSYSDNRLMNGNVYDIMGMKFAYHVRPDFYYVRGVNRFHKSSLRKKFSERTSGLTETKLRQKEGYSRVWDLGKKKWEIFL